ncbi:glycoside hydrolase [Paracoccaceae bacterium]|nr:glycoside hydrolase [Paracoccaceae bacterium]
MYRAKKSLLGLIFSIIVLTWATSFSNADNGLFTAIEKVPLPTEVGAQEASLTSKDGILYMTWMENVNTLTKVMFSMKTAIGWSEPTPVHIGHDLFVNWADFPSIAILSDTTIAVHWLQKIGKSGFDYQINIALSSNNGKTWSNPKILHEDRSPVQHGFVSMTPSKEKLLTIIWLDGRTYGVKLGETKNETEAMQLRATTITSEGIIGKEVVIDKRTCSCCQTSITVTDKGTVIAAYRDRSEGEIRDISIVRLERNGWQEPFSLNDDGWEISGCPVNGPAISSIDRLVAVAWFTGAKGVSAVKIAFSDDDGRSFATPLIIEHQDPIGRVDLEMLPDGSALVSWVEWIDGNEVISICRASQKHGCKTQQLLALNAGNEPLNFPQLERVNEDVYLVWTQPDENGDNLSMLRLSPVPSKSF